MARPKRRLTIEDIEQASAAADYFKRMFAKESKHLESTVAKKKGESAIAAQRVALEKLNALPSLYRSEYDHKIRKEVRRSTDQVAASLTAFLGWAEECITDVGWTRCLANLRQARHTKPGLGKFISLKLPARTHYELKRWASTRSHTLNDALLELLKIANTRAGKR